MRQYDDFIKKVEANPFDALFGNSNRWLGWAVNQDSQSSRTEVNGGMSKATNRVEENAKPYDKQEKPQARAESKSPDKSQANLSEPQTTHEPKTPEFREADYEIDPITLRKVPKPQVKSASAGKPIAAKNAGSTDIPVKKFRSAEPDQATARQGYPPFTSEMVWPEKDWLSQEGFKKTQSGSRNKEENDSLVGIRSRKIVPKIESALDRQLQKKADAGDGSNRTLSYQEEDTKTEDIDLLRASDVRASSGLREQSRKSSPGEKAAHQRRLEEESEKRHEELQKRLDEELQNDSNKLPSSGAPLKDPQRVSVSEGSRNKAGNPQLDADRPASMFEVAKSAKLSSFENAKSRQIRAKFTPLKVNIDLMKLEYDTLRQRWLDETRRLKLKRTQSLLDREVMAHKEAMAEMETRNSAEERVDSSGGAAAEERFRGEGDVASNVHEFAHRPRWYKREAPHAKNDMDAKLQQLARDKAFVQEIRGIYEDAYGVIDTKHRQPAANIPETTNTPSAKPLLKEDPSSHILSDTGNSPSTQPSSPPTPPQSVDSPVDNSRATIKELSDELDWAYNTLSVERTKHRRELAEAQKLILSPNTEESRLHKVNEHEKTLKMLKRASQLTKSSSALRDETLSKALQSSGENLSNLKRSMSYAMDGTTGHNLWNPMLQNMEAAAQEASVEAPKSTGETPTTYRFLGYDVTSQRITWAKTTAMTQLENEYPLKPLQALRQLQNPGKFLPQLHRLHEKGYDIVSGAPNLLVLKKVRELDSKFADEAAYHADGPNPIDGTIASSPLSSAAGNYASPTGFVNHDPPASHETTEPDYIDHERVNDGHLSDKVHRKEAVFSGAARGHWQDGMGRRLTKKNKKAMRRRKAFRQILLTGSVTAAMCYAVGVAIEMLKV